MLLALSLVVPLLVASLEGFSARLLDPVSRTSSFVREQLDEVQAQLQAREQRHAGTVFAATLGTGAFLAGAGLAIAFGSCRGSNCLSSAGPFVGGLMVVVGTGIAVFGVITAGVMALLNLVGPPAAGEKRRELEAHERRLQDELNTMTERARGRVRLPTGQDLASPLTLTLRF